MKATVLLLIAFGSIVCLAKSFNTPAKVETIPLEKMNWVQHVLSGEPFNVVLEKDFGRMVKDRVYIVRYINEAFETTGYDFQEDTIVTASFTFMSPMHKEISLWGSIFEFDRRGNLYRDKEFMGTMSL